MRLFVKQGNIVDIQEVIQEVSSCYTGSRAEFAIHLLAELFVYLKKHGHSTDEMESILTSSKKRFNEIMDWE